MVPLSIVSAFLQYLPLNIFMVKMRRRALIRAAE